MSLIILYTTHLLDSNAALKSALGAKSARLDAETSELADKTVKLRITALERDEFARKIERLDIKLASANLRANSEERLGCEIRAELDIVEGLREEVKKQKEDITALLTYLCNLSRLKVQLKDSQGSQIAAHRGTIAKLESDNASLVRESVFWMKVCVQLKAANLGLADEAAESDEKMMDLESKIAYKDKVLEARAAASESQAGELRAFSAQIKYKADELHGMTKEMGILRKRNEGLESELGRANEWAIGAQTKIEDLEGALGKANGFAGDMHRKLVDRDEEVRQLKEELEFCESLLESTTEENRVLRRCVEGLEGRDVRLELENGEAVGALAEGWGSRWGSGIRRGGGVEVRERGERGEMEERDDAGSGEEFDAESSDGEFGESSDEFEGYGVESDEEGFVDVLSGVFGEMD